MLSKLGWSFVQVQLESSYDGFGTSNLQTDCQQLDLLVDYLKTERHKSTIVFLGHSTGSQDCYWHNKYGQTSSSVSGYILQAPVSDRQHFAANLDHFEASLALAIQLRNEGKGDELLPRKTLDAPVTADRFYSFAARLGDDDVFSTDFTDEEIKRLFADLHQPICWVYSEKDEFYASDKDKTLVMHRFQSLCPAIIETHIIPEGDHNITRKDSQEAFCLVVKGFLNRFS
ncbi:uncharacterized protein B0P05DRAFT_542262 [Gilbertella persicaria]|uniref:uncharacterized protein n=1 Tax=Gilbertella persicaria TaxID=101096 RepID=UPI0022205843|nr:uncharacterized protein B0P05DRAFT_542262 [Gilbertella persicaria]KAI8079083.1 hypothetical protein B0P05DRAFT_542262 [Gilbertella persicaria]